MDKPPSNFYNLISQTKKIISIILFTSFFCVFYFSCSNTSPEISQLNTKVVYDYENEVDKPVQKLSVYLEMNSEVRRIEQINIYHKETGYRWIIKNPVIFESKSIQYAGYSNCQIAGSFNNIPEGEYQVCYYDSQGRETFTKFEIEKNDKAVSDLKKLKNYLKTHPSNLLIALYDENSKVLSYSMPDSSFEINKENQTYNGTKIFASNKKAAYFRLFYESEDKVYILPKIYKDSKKDNNENTEKKSDENVKKD